MPEVKICPFLFIFSRAEHMPCNKSECEFWSEEVKMCSISLGMSSLFSIYEAIRGISENIKSLDSFQS